MMDNDIGAQAPTLVRSIREAEAKSNLAAASLLHAPLDGGLGLPLKPVQVRMGHSTLAMTADTYGHLFPSQDDTEELAAGERALMGA